MRRDGPLPDDRGPGGRELGGLARPRQGLRGARRPGRCSAPTTTSTSAASPSAARSTPGRRSTRWPPSPRRCGSARSSPPRRSAIPPSWRRSSTTADHVSGGRVELGLGAGWHEREHRAYGFPFPPLRERMDRLEEQLEIVHGTWTDRPFSFSGAHYRLEGLDAQPRPLQAPHPPLLMGGVRRAAQRCARRALGGRVQHPVRVARGGALAQGARRRGVRRGRPRADPVLADDRLPGRARPRGAAREVRGARRRHGRAGRATSTRGSPRRPRRGSSARSTRSRRSSPRCATPASPA